MVNSLKTLRTCKKGHQYYKSSDCPVCPICENEKIVEADFLQSLAAPARRALESVGINSLELLAQKSESEILALHGMGKNSIETLKASLNKSGLSFKDS
ncbi:MAG: hypothetical protein V4683_11245 [Bacteroidota bacterium]